MVAIFMAMLAIGTGIVSAHQSPASCSTVGLGISIAEGPSIYHAEDVINYMVTVVLPKTTDCDVSNITVAVIKPDGTNTTVTGINLNQSQNTKDLGPFPYTVKPWDKILTAKTSASSAEAHSVIMHQNVSASAEISAMVIHPAITVDKTCTPQTQLELGTITWTISTNNTGDTPLKTNVTDSMHGIIFSGMLEAGDLNVTVLTNTGLAAGSYTNIATATGTDMLGKQVSSASSATCSVTSPPSGKHKVVGNGRTASGEFTVWVYSHFLPNGEVEFTDEVNHVTIKSISIGSINTDKTVIPMTGEITGQATINGAGSHKFVLRVKDRGNPPDDSDDAFEISVPSIEYSGGGKATSGNIQVIY